MEKAVIATGLIAAAAAILLLRAARGTSQSSTDDQGTEEGSTTAGDEASNILEDGAAQVMSIFTNWPTGSEPYQGVIQQAADDNGVPVAILSWLLWKESRYRPEIIDGSVTSKVGALGIAQFMPATAVEQLGSEDAALDPGLAIPGAARYLAKLRAQVGSWEAALAAYNWGVGNVMRKGLSAAPPETRDYYTSILNHAGSYA
jgi:soluble lytic murein transglycosylase-like protein